MLINLYLLIKIVVLCIPGERYNPSHSCDWEHVSEMSTPRSNFAAVVLDGMIFALGGYSGKAFSS
jgi:hypothetical protein